MFQHRLAQRKKYWTVRNTQPAVYQVDSVTRSAAISVVKKCSSAQFLTETNTRQTLTDKSMFLALALPHSTDKGEARHEKTITKPHSVQRCYTETRDYIQMLYRTLQK